eukprot:TRINITY_DN10766_c0_g1_i3.p1 TRINITY_DN10766_c0_g1~~TRINITY_DN10766_c0_g1_i3.p1  ORF type:complete len:548 (-),score=114.85 TRINITY_DN10766_c0_g1_i3:294-1937(-)
MTHIDINNISHLKLELPEKLEVPDNACYDPHQIDDGSHQLGGLEADNSPLPLLQIDDLTPKTNNPDQFFLANNTNSQQFFQPMHADNNFSMPIQIQSDFSQFAQYAGYGGMVPMPMQQGGGRFSLPLGFPTHLALPPPPLPDHPLLNGALKRTNFGYQKMRSDVGGLKFGGTNAMVDVQGDKSQTVKHESSTNSLQTSSKLDLFKESSPRTEVENVNVSKSGKKRSSKYRGVTKHRRSGRWEAHIWVKELGRQVYLGGYENEDHAAEAYDVAAIKCKGAKVKTNFNIEKYSELIKCMDNISLDELIMAVRRQSQGFARGTSSYRGVTYHPSGRWESRIGIPGSKHIYLGLYEQEADAAKAYDRSLVRLRGSSAATNFALSDYRTELADYHKMQQLVLMGPDVEKVLGTGPEFERWIKYGNKGGDEQIQFLAQNQQQQQQQHQQILLGCSQKQVGGDVQQQQQVFPDFDKEFERASKRFKGEVIEQVGESHVEATAVQFLQPQDIQVDALDTDMDLYKFQNDIEVPLNKIFNPDKTPELTFEQTKEDC